MLFLSALFDRAELRRQRRHLARLDDHLLADIGLTRAQALAPPPAPEWQAPGHWQTSPRPPRRQVGLSDATPAGNP